MIDADDMHIKVASAVRKIVPLLRHCQAMNITVAETDKGRLVLALPYQQQLVGNPDTGVIHGGALTTLLDTACGFAALLAMEKPNACPTLDLRIDYMRPAKPGETILGEAEVYRLSNTIVFTRAVAYHEGEKNEPIAHCTASFMRLKMYDTLPMEEFLHHMVAYYQNTVTTGG